MSHHNLFELKRGTSHRPALVTEWLSDVSFDKTFAFRRTLKLNINIKTQQKSNL